MAGLRIGESALNKLEEFGVEADHKMLFRIGSCATGLKRWDLAVSVLQRAVEECPDGATAELAVVNAKLREARAGLAAEKKKERHAYKKLFSGGLSEREGGAGGT